MGLISGKLVVELRDLSVDENDEDEAIGQVLATVRSTMSGQLCAEWRNAIQAGTLDLEDVEFQPSMRTAAISITTEWSGHVLYDPSEVDISSWVTHNAEVLIAENIDPSWSVDDTDSGEVGNESYDANDGDLEPATRPLSRRIDSLVIERSDQQAKIAGLEADLDILKDRVNALTAQPPATITAEKMADVLRTDYSRTPEDRRFILMRAFDITDGDADALLRGAMTE